jgi:hypothetical protein
MHVAWLAAAAGLALPAAQQFATAQETAAQIQVIDITPPGVRRPAEVSIAIDPTNASHVIAGERRVP